MTAVRALRLARPANGLALVASGLLAACAPIGPDYRRPDVPVPAAWLQPAPAAPAASATAGIAPPSAVRAADGPPVGAAELVNTAWWKAIGDPGLDALIQAALDENKNLRIAAYRIDQFDAMLQVTQVGRPAAGRRGRPAHARHPEPEPVRAS